MRDEAAKLVDPILRYGLDVKDKLDAGERVEIRETQLNLKRLLADKEWTRIDSENSNVLGTSGVFGSARSPGASLAKSPSSFQGVRYALACWLDELFISHSPWGGEWRDNSLEYDRYKSTDAAWRFWEEAQKAEGLPGTDALEVYYLCVMLGFRGNKSEEPNDLNTWVERVRPQLLRSYGEEPAQTDRSEPVNYVPLLTGRDRFMTMFRWWGIALLFFLFVLAAVLVARTAGGG